MPSAISNALDAPGELRAPQLGSKVSAPYNLEYSLERLPNGDPLGSAKPPANLKAQYKAISGDSRREAVSVAQFRADTYGAKLAVLVQ